MKRLTKQLALLVAGVLMTTGAASGLPLPQELRGSAQTDALSRFMQQVAAGSTQRDDDEQFCSLRYSAREQKIYRDGVPVGKSFAGCSVQGGRLMISTDGQNMLPPQEAAKQIGCEVREDNGDVTVSFPFRSRRLIVKAAQTPPLQGGRLVADGYRDLFVVEFDTQQAAYRAYQAYQQDGQIEFVDSDRTLAAADLGAFNAVKDIDPEMRSWGVADIGADTYCAWLKEQKQTLPEIRVAVVDTGVYAEHEWLAGRVLEGGAGFMEDGDGGWEDGHGHGTHCSGIIVSSTPENVKILPVKVLSDEGFGSTLEVYCGMMYAVEQDVDVISMSLGGEGESPLLSEAAAAMAEKDIPCCVAAGNDTQDAKYHHPAHVESVITISAIDSSHNLADFSNFGAGIDFAAPGVNINSSVNTSPTATEEWDGTSMATPFAAAAVADLLSYDPTLTTAEVYDLLRAAAVDIGEPGFDESFGWGEISLADMRFDAQYCPSPRFSPPGDDYSEPTDVTLSCTVTEGPASVIYYTTDGSDPDPATSEQYSGPITVSKSMVIKALAVSGDAVSRISSATYRINNMEVENPFVVEDGVLVSYLGVMDAVNLINHFPDGSLRAIGSGAFANNSRLQSIIIPSSVTEIGDRAFYHCENLSYIEAENVSAIGEEAFLGCSSLYTLNAKPLEHLGAGAFRGCSEFRMLASGLSPEIEAIPAQAFRGCTLMTYLEMQGVKEIGDYAFADCFGISDSSAEQMFHFDRYETIGAHAFDSAALPNVLDLSSLSELGAYAFAKTNVGEITLPAQITALPDGVFQYADGLRRLTAPGVTVIGKSALEHYGDAPILLEIDFSKVTDIGSCALFGITFVTPVVFDSLQTIRPDAFRGVYGPSLSFPAVTELRRNTFSYCGVKALIFENLVSIERGAAEAVNILAVGGSLEKAEPLCIEYAELLAGPADSPLAAFAADAEIEYQTIPSLGAVQRSVYTDQYDDCALYAIPLGFGDLHVRWSDDAGNVVQDDSTGVLYASTANEGFFTYRAELMEGDNVLSSELFEVTVEPLDYKTDGVVGTDELCIVDWDARCANTQRPEDGSSFSLDASYLFCPEKTGMYRFLITRGACELMIRGSDGTNIYQDVSDSDSEIVPFYAMAGQNYLLFLSRYIDDPEDMAAECAGLSVFRITDSSAESLTTVGNYSIFGDLEGAEENSYLFAGEPITPNVQNVRYYNEALDEMVPMTEGEDYIVCYSRCDHVGTGYAIIAGIGRYCGSAYLSYQINGVITEENPVELGVLAGGFAEMHFIAEEDGDYTFYLDYTPEWLDEQIARGICNENAWSVHAYVVVYDRENGESTELDSSGGLNCSQLSGVTVTLKKGGHYVISVGSFGLTEASTTLYVSRGVSLLGDYEIGTVEAGQPFDGTPAEPKIVCEPELTEGVDYKINYLHNDIIGTMLVVVQGIGSVRGTVFLPYELFGVLNDGSRIHIDTIDHCTYSYCFTPQASGSYVFYTDFPDSMITDMIETDTYSTSLTDCCLDTTLTILDADGDEVAFNDDRCYGLSALTTELTAGESYTVELRGYYMNLDIGVDLCVSSGRTHMSELDVMCANTVDPEEGAYPLVSVWENDDSLQEGPDYTLQFIGGLSSGRHLCIISGLGVYVGRYYAEYWVSDGSDDLPNQIEFGEEFTVADTETGFRFDVSDYADIRLRPTDGIETAYSAEIYSLWQEKSWYLDQENQDVSLENDSYSLMIRQEEPLERTFVLELVRERTHIAVCDVEVENAYYTGSPLTPQITVSYWEQPLQENVDYVIEENPEMIEVGVYAVKIIGIDHYYGEKVFYFSILPNDLNELPELTDGKYTAEITEPGQTLIYRWTPKCQGCCIVSDTILNKQFNIFSGSQSVDSLNGVGYLCFEPGLLANRTYVVTVSFRSPSQTGTIHFEVKSEYEDLYLCDSEYEKIIPFDSAGAVPDYTMSYHGDELEEGKDYEVIYVGGNMHYGRAEICLRGIGRFVGEQVLPYYICPGDVGLFWRDEVEQVETLTLDETVSLERGLPGTAAMFTFSAPSNGTYYFSLPNNGVTAFIYDSEGNVRSRHERSLEMKTSDSCYVVVFTDWLENAYEDYEEYEVSVSMTAPDAYWFDEEYGVSYYIHDGIAEVDFILYGLVGVCIRDEVTDPETGISAYVLGMTEGLKEEVRDTMTFYCTPGGIAQENWLEPDGFTFASLYPENAEKGDVTGDGKVDRHDALTLQRLIAEGEGMVLRGAAVEAADMNSDGVIDLSDVRAILKAANA